MFKRILTPLDGSTLSEGILPYVRALAPALGAGVDLLQMHQEATYQLEQLNDTEQASITAALEPLNLRLQRQSEAYLSRIAYGLMALGVKSNIYVRYGSPAQQIVAEAEKQDDTLIAMSTRGHAGIGRWVMGSVTDRVLHTTMTPLLVVPPERDAPATDSVATISTLIVPLDGSDLAETVLPIAAELSKASGAGVLLARVLDEPARSSLNVSELAASGVSEATREEGEAAEYLGAKADQLREAGASDVRTRVVRGRPVEEIEELARTTPGSMVVACTHGRSGVGRAVMGSVTDRLVRHSGLPALIVRARG